MQISWYGHSCFRINLKGKAGLDQAEGITIVTDPFDKSLGLTTPRFKADLVLVSHNHFDHNNTEPFPEAVIIREPGEYDLKGIEILGVRSFHDEKQGAERGENIIFKIKAEEINLVHLGDLGQKELQEHQLEKLGEVDVLFIPVGGTYTIDAKTAQAVVAQIEPRIVIPMHYKIPKLDLAIAAVEPFLKEMGVEKTAPVEKLSLKKKDLPQQELKVVLFKPPTSA